MITFDRVTVTYPDASTPTLQNVNLAVEEGHLALVIGATGSGKSTLLRCVNGLVPHFSGGRLNGTVTVDGRTTDRNRPRDLADVVGYVGQDPDAELCRGHRRRRARLRHGESRRGPRDNAPQGRGRAGHLEPAHAAPTGHQHTFGWPAPACRHRRRLHRRARALVLDEPTSSLDPVSAEEVLASMARLVHDQGTTILVAEHRLERIVQFVDVVVELGGAPDEIRSGTPSAIFATARRLRPSSGWLAKPVGPQFPFRSETLVATLLSSGVASRRARGSTAPPSRRGPSPRVRGLTAVYGPIPALAISPSTSMRAKS